MYKLDTASATPPYLQVKEQLRAEISSGRAAVGRALPTEAELARQFGLSRMTVRRAVVELTAEGLLRRVRGQGTFVRPGAAAVARKAAADGARLQTLGVVCMPGSYDDRRSLFYARLLRGIQDAATARSASIALRPARATPAAFVRDLEAGRALDGVVAFGITDRRLVNALAACRLPVAFVDCIGPTGRPDVGTVRSAGDDAAYQAVTCLVRLGHRDIGILTFDEETDVVAPRRAGYERAMREAGCRTTKSRTYPTNVSVEGGYATMRRIVAAGDVPTALFCCSDEMALGVVAAAQEHGMLLPRDLSVVGFGDSGYFSAPPLSMVRIPIERMATAAVDLVAARVADPHAPLGAVFVPCEWIPRATCDVPRDVSKGRA